MIVEAVQRGPDSFSNFLAANDDEHARHSTRKVELQFVICEIKFSLEKRSIFL